MKIYGIYGVYNVSISYFEYKRLKDAYKRYYETLRAHGFTSVWDYIEALYTYQELSGNINE